MPVIGDREFKFRVNVTRTDSGSLRRTTGSFTICQPYRPPGGMRSAECNAEFCRVKFQAIEDRACGMANRIFPRLPCRR